MYLNTLYTTKDGDMLECKYMVMTLVLQAVKYMYTDLALQTPGSWAKKVAAGSCNFPTDSCKFLTAKLVLESIQDFPDEFPYWFAAMKTMLQ